VNDAGGSSIQQRWRVVIVDDSADDRADVRRLLLKGSSRIYELFEADTGAAGIRAILGAPGGVPDCVILDCHLPDADAPEVLAQLTGPDGEVVCPVVVVTGSNGLELGRAVLRAGAQDFIGKSWMTAESLTRAVENAMERWAMARDLRTSNSRLRLALEASKTGIWTWDLDADHVTWTAECYEIYGVAEEAFDRTSAGFFRFVHPDDRAATEATARAAIADHVQYHAEVRVIRPAGEVLWVEYLGRASYGAGGEPRWMIGTVTDISARKRAEETLRARERELRSLADNSPDVLARFDRELRYVFISAAVERATGQLPADVIGKTHRELGVPAATCELWEAGLGSVFATGQPASQELDFDAPGGKRFYDVRMVAELGASGAVEFVLAVIHDATDRRSAERTVRAALDEAQRAVRTRDQLVSLVSHDLKSPLNTMVLGISLLEEEAIGDDGRRVLHKMARQTRRMGKMIDELLDVARLNAGMPLGLVLRETDLVPLVRNVVAEYQESAPDHRIEVQTAVGSLVGTWDANRLDRVVNNLLSNAVKYSPGGGSVQVSLALAREGGRAWAVLGITDAGIGIGPGDRDRVFQWYSRGDNALRTTIPGTGIGLAGSRDIVMLHGGSISVESEEGKGSTFTVRLPTDREAAPPPPSMPSSAR
jgi:PAS domain S-box-containing protein